MPAWAAAGAGQTSAVERLLSRAHPFASFEIETDAHTAWLGAFNGDDGAILIVGTGSCGYGGTSGDCHYVGGWGYEISDEGSGAAIGRELLRRCIWAHDGRAPSTPLSDAVLAEFNNDLEVLVDWVGKARPADYGRYAPLVLDHAKRDPLGVAIVAEAAAGLGASPRACSISARPPSACSAAWRNPWPWLPPPVQRTITLLPRMRSTALSFSPASRSGEAP